MDRPRPHVTVIALAILAGAVYKIKEAYIK